MKKALLIFWISFLPFFSLGCFGQNQPGKANPKANDLFSWDFGQVEQGKVLQHTFILKNESGKVLNIKGTNTSCGCTVSKIEKKTLSPGKSTTIDVRFNSKGYSGPVQQFIYVNTDSLDASTSSFDKLRTNPERVKRVEGSLSINGERSRTIDNPIIKYTIKAEVVK